MTGLGLIALFIIAIIIVLKLYWNHNTSSNPSDSLKRISGNMKTGLIFGILIPLILLSMTVSSPNTEEDFPPYYEEYHVIDLEMPRTDFKENKAVPPPPPPRPKLNLEVLPQDIVLNSPTENFIEDPIDDKLPVRIGEGSTPAPPPTIFPPPPPTDDGKDYIIVENMPRFPGCESEGMTREEKEECSKTKLMNFLIKNVKYPRAAKEIGQEGVAVVRFTVNQEGRLENIKLSRDPGVGLGDAAMTVVELMNDIEPWTPGRQRGKKVKVLYTVPIKFKLQ